MTEHTLLIIKPDGVRRNLVEDILKRVGDHGFSVVARKDMVLTRELAGDLYAVHMGKHFFDNLMKYALSGPVVVLKLQRVNAIQELRNLIGATDPLKAKKGTIRGDLKDPNSPKDPSVMENLVHASDSVENANRELEIFFPS